MFNKLSFSNETKLGNKSINNKINNFSVKIF